MLSRKVASNLGRNLSIRHLVDYFDAYNASAQVDSLKTPIQLALCFARTKYQN
jgi:hypothetical protein